MKTQTTLSAARQPWPDRRGGRATLPLQGYPRLAIRVFPAYELLIANARLERTLTQSKQSAGTESNRKWMAISCARHFASLINGAAIRTSPKVLKT
jgi:hypothetical protein